MGAHLLRISRVLGVHPTDINELPAAVLHTADGQTGNTGKRLVGQS
jgi:hypothetical protein